MSFKSVQPGTKLNIKGRRSNNAEVVYVSRTLRILDEVNHILAAERPVFGGEDMAMSREVEYEIVALTSSDVLSFKGCFEGFLTGSDSREIALRLTGDSSKVQRRSFYRHSCNLAMQYTIIDFEEGDELAEIFHAAGMTEKFEGTMLDISGGGLRFEADKNHDLANHVECHFKLGKVQMTIRGEVLEKTSNQDGGYQYRVSFINSLVSAVDREKIISYIFKKKREQAKNASAQKDE